MMPPGVVGDGMLKVALITTFTPPTLAATAAIAGVDVTCEFTVDGFNRAGSEATVTDDRLCSTETGEEPGRFTPSLDTIYVWDQQNDEDYLLYGTLKRGVKRFFVVRYAMPYTTPFAAGQTVDVIDFTAGQQMRQAVAANEKLKINQKQFIAAGGEHRDLVLT
jgi:hypothetical protein